MKQFKKSCISMTLAVFMLLSVSVQVFAGVADDKLASAVTRSAEYMFRTVRNPQVGSIGGEWAVIGLARSGYDLPQEYYRDYYATVEKYVEACGGVLHKRKYTEYSRVTVALSAIGKDARNVAGYDLTYPLGDYDKTIWQGMNGPIWALIALDSGNYPMPQNKEAKTQATRQMYIDRILDCQLNDGGWSLFGGTSAAADGDGVSDPDITGMALQALAKYQDQPAVKKATEEALECMSKKQNAQGGFGSWGTTNSESVVQMLVALCELGIDTDDPRFVKNGYTLLDNLLTFSNPDGGFRHIQDGSGSDQMAAEQGFYGIVAALRAAEGKNSLYRMSDAISIDRPEQTEPASAGLEGKHKDVKAASLVDPGVTFSDISAHKNQPAIEALASRGIIDGVSDDRFAPDEYMTRAQFAAVVVRALGLPLETTSDFADVDGDAWYAPYIGAAYSYGIINGRTATIFDPEYGISRQEAAVMLARAAGLCGMDSELENYEILNLLAQFDDYTKIAKWAREGMAFCYGENIMDQSDLSTRPNYAIKRCEMAQMLFELLGRAKLL